MRDYTKKMQLVENKNKFRLNSGRPVSPKLASFVMGVACEEVYINRSGSVNTAKVVAARFPGLDDNDVYEIAVRVSEEAVRAFLFVLPHVPPSVRSEAASLIGDVRSESPICA